MQALGGNVRQEDGVHMDIQKIISREIHSQVGSVVFIVCYKLIEIITRRFKDIGYKLKEIIRIAITNCTA